MSKPKKEYVVLLKDDEYKQMIRDWIGTHNGMSILKSDWCYVEKGASVDSYDTYIIGITNPKTEMLFVLTFPEAIKKDKMRGDASNLSHWWTISVSNEVTPAF